MVLCLGGVSSSDLLIQGGGSARRWLIALTDTVSLPIQIAKNMLTFIQHQDIGRMACELTDDGPGS
jgi:hypothetical protein